jgi:hypothetical protein
MSPHPAVIAHTASPKIGEGGMRAVYRATDTKLIHDSDLWMAIQESDFSGVQRIRGRQHLDPIPIDGVLQHRFRLADLPGNTTYVVDYAIMDPVSRCIRGCRFLLVQR